MRWEEPWSFLPQGEGTGVGLCYLLLTRANLRPRRCSSSRTRESGLHLPPAPQLDCDTLSILCPGARGLPATPPPVLDLDSEWSRDLQDPGPSL